MALRRNVPLGQNFESFQTAASDATRILTRNINIEWQKLEKYKELSDAKEEEKISCQERLRQLNENKNILERQLISTERRAQSLKNSHAELKRSLYSIRRQEDKASKDFKTEKKMLDEKIAYYQAKWRERYETRYANKPLVQEYEKAKNALADKREELKLLKSALHGCKADIFKAKCERGKRNAEESGFYPLESFIIRVASIGAEVMKLEYRESQLMKVITILQQNINNKEKLAQLKAQHAKEIEKGKSQPSIEPERVRESTFFKKVSTEPMKRREITDNSYPVPQKIIRKEDSLLNKYSIKKSKPIQGVVAQTPMRQKGNECSKGGIQEEGIRSRIEKLKLYTPRFFSPPDMLSKNDTSDSSSREITRQSNDSVVSENFQTLGVKDVILHHKKDLQMGPTESENSNAAPKKATNIAASRARLQELTNKTLQNIKNKTLHNIKKVDSGERYASFLKETAVQSKSYIPPTFQACKEKSKINETSDHISVKSKNYAELMESNTTQKFSDCRRKESLIANETDLLKTSQELFPNIDKQMQPVHKSDSSEFHKNIPEACKKLPRFQKEINSPKVFREFYEGGIKEMQLANDNNSEKTRPSAANEKYATYCSGILSTPDYRSSTTKDRSFEAFNETNLSREQEARKEEARKREEYKTAPLESFTKHQSYRNAQNMDNIRGQQFRSNELTKSPPMFENGNENMAYNEDIGNHQKIDNIRCQQFRHNIVDELTEGSQMLENGNEPLSYNEDIGKQHEDIGKQHEDIGKRHEDVGKHHEDIGKHQHIQHLEKSKTSSVSTKVVQNYTDHINEAQDIYKKQQNIITSHETKNSFSTSSNLNQEPMDIDNLLDMQNIVEDNGHDKEYMAEDNVYPEFRNLSREKLAENSISMDVEENQPSTNIPNSSVDTVREIQNQTYGNNSEVISHSKSIFPTSAASYVSYSNPNEASRDNRDNQSKNILPISNVSDVTYSNPTQVPQGFGNDHVNSSLSQDTVKVQGVDASILMKPTERHDECNEVNMQGETEPTNYTQEPELVKSQPISQSNVQEPDEISHIKYQDTQSSGNSGLVENGVYPNGTVEAGVFQCSSKSTTSSEMHYYTPKSDFSSKLQPHSHSPVFEEARTPVLQEVSAAPSPFDFEKHIQILGDLKKTPTFVYQTRQMYKSGNDSPSKEAQNKMSQEPSESGKDIFSTFSFFEGPTTAGKESVLKSSGSEKSKTEETGFMSFALEDYLADSPDSPEAAGKEKSMFAFSSDSPKDDVKSPPGFFPLFAADTQETGKESKSGFSLNFGGNTKVQSPEEGSSFKFLF